MKEKVQELNSKGQTADKRDWIEEGRQTGLVQGIAMAINYMYRGNNEADIWRAAGLTFEECVQHGVDDFDMEELLKHREELEG